MYIPGEHSGWGVSLESPGYENARGGSKIHLIQQEPDLVARNARLLQLRADMPPVDEDLAEALFRLSDEYGIDFPGIGCLAIKADNAYDVPDVGHIYTTAHVVEGVNMHKEMLQVPLETTLETLEKILTYYEDMSRDFSDRLYLADLSLRQCMYGRTLGQTAIDSGMPRALFIDYDRRLSNISTIAGLHEKLQAGEPAEYFGGGIGGIAGLDDDLYVLLQNYPDQNFNQIAVRLLNIANCQGIFYKVPTAYEHVKAIS